MEEWKSIEGYNDKYLISNYGRVKSLYDNKGKYRELIRTLRVGKQGYYYVNLWKNSKSKTAKVHRLVAEHFLDKIAGKEVVNHIDGNKLNNVYTNLEWVTLSENSKHAYLTGLSNPTKNFENKKNFGWKKVNQYDLNGNFIKQWDSIKDAETTLQIHGIGKNCRDVSKSAGNYKWSFAEGGGANA